jgi:hypothetical protein
MLDHNITSQGIPVEHTSISNAWLYFRVDMVSISDSIHPPFIAVQLVTVGMVVVTMLMIMLMMLLVVAD